MKSLLLSIKNLFPYLLLIGVYFFFINIEATRIRKNNKRVDINKKYNSNIKDINLRISIPVIPYRE